MTEKLFIFYVGGMVEGCHVELHDVRFSSGRTAEDCWDDLRMQWWGLPKSLHLDAWGAIDHADGYDILLEPGPAADTSLKLWFVNLGGYDPAKFTELHENLILVAPDAATAKARALEQVTGWVTPHKDNVLDVDALLDLSTLFSRGGRHIHLRRSGVPKPFQFEARYVPIGKMGKER